MIDSTLIILSAGRSSRMGQHKALLTVGDTHLILKHISDFKKCGGQRIEIVLGHNVDDFWQTIPSLQNHVGRWEDFEGLKLKIVINPNYDMGQFSSIQCGLKGLADISSQSIFLMPVDMLLPCKNVLEGMFNVCKGGVEVVIPRYNGRGGHPVLFTERFSNHLRTLCLDDSQSRLDIQIKNLKSEEVFNLDVDDQSILLNINTPADLNRLVNCT